MRPRSLAAAGLVLLAGCGLPAPPPPSAEPGSPAPETASVTPSAEVSASESPPAPAEALEIRVIDQRFTTRTLDYRSDGTGLLWSSSAADGPDVPYAADLWHYVPGGSDPQRIFVNPNRDSTLDLVGGDGDGHFAFVERNPRLLGDSGWQLWYLAEPNAAPELLDASDEATEAVPFFDVDGGRVAWGTVHATPDGPRSQLFLAEPAQGDPTMLQEGDPNEIGFQFPSLGGDSLAYSAFEAPGGDPAAQEFRAYRLDLSDPDATPERLDATGDVAMPVLADTDLVWKRSAQNAYGWGSLEVADPTADDRFELDPAAMHTDEELAFNYPSVGDGYLAAHDPNHNSLYIFDMVGRRPLLIEDLGEDRQEGEREAVVVRPHVAGRLLAYVEGSDDATRPLTLKYVELPPPGGG